jgi:Protein of unknown function (DUF3105)
VQAPQTRRDERPRRTLVVVAAVAALALVGAAGAFFLLRDDSSPTDPVAATMREAGCTFETFTALAPGVHISDPEARPEEWNSFPPTSGPHHGQWVIWGQYDEEVPLASAVHNLEHGGIVIYHGPDVPQEEVDRLIEFYRDEPAAMLVAPLEELEDRIALTAWYVPELNEPGQGILAECTRFDEGAFESFRDAYQFMGPERFQPADLVPGT